MASEGVATAVTDIAATAAPAATEAIAQTAAQGAAEVGKTAIETGAETLGESAVKAAEAQASVLNEGIAQSAESAMDVGGADAALSSIGSANVAGEVPAPAGVATAENNTDPSIDPSTSAETPIKSAEPLPNVTDSGMDLRAIDATNARIDQLKREGQDVSLEQRHEIYGEELQKIKGTDTVSEDANVDAAGTADVGSPVVQSEQAAVDTGSGISEEIKNDPDFQQKLEEEREGAHAAGEPVDENQLSQRALDKFNQGKQVEGQQLTPEQQQILQLNKAVTELKEMVESLTNELIEKEQDPKKKESLLMLLAKIAAIVVVGSVVEGGKTVAPSIGAT